jgi:RNA polymerase sigma factor for flagellar operon FliA
MRNSSSGKRTPNDLIVSCQGLVRSIAWKIHQKLPSSVDLDDLIGYGQLGLAEAARDFDASRGTQFTTYAYYRIRGAVLDGLSRMSWFRKADYSAGRYERLANDVLSGQEPEQPGDSDAAWFAQTTRSLGMAFVMTNFVGGSAELEPIDSHDPAADAETADICSVVRGLLDELPEQEQVLMRAIYFEGLSIKDAGERVAISKAWASRLHARILEQLATKLSAVPA